MAGVDMLMESALKLLVSRIPQEHIDKLANVAQIAIDLDAKLNLLLAQHTALDQGQRELRTLLVALVQQLSKGNDDGRAIADGEHAGI
jgi:hypothetical protein